MRSTHLIESLESRRLCSAIAGTLQPLGSVPALNSLPAASAKIYLDFNGDTPRTTPAFDQDGAPSTFSDGDLAGIREIWARVSEKFSPFNINVTTVDSGVYTPGQTLRLLIGGNAGQSTYTGFAIVGGFNGVNNTAYVYSQNLYNDPGLTAEIAARESGAAFGLHTQSLYAPDGSKLSEFNTGDGWTAPLLGLSYGAIRGVWWNGSTAALTVTEDELAIIGGSLNRFGFRADDHGNDLASAEPLAVAGDSVSGSGVIEKMTDSDWFSFTTGAGTVNFTASAAQYGPTLNLGMKLIDSSGRVVAIADSPRESTHLGESFSLNVAAGTYRLVVFSHGDYGDVGQYTIRGTVNGALPATPPPPPPPPVIQPPAPNPLGAPSDMVATYLGGHNVKLNWHDNSNAEKGFYIEKSADGVKWSQIKGLAANTTTWTTANDLAYGKSYSFRVRAYRVVSNKATYSPYSNVASVAIAKDGKVSPAPTPALSQPPVPNQAPAPVLPPAPDPTPNPSTLPDPATRYTYRDFADRPLSVDGFGFGDIRQGAAADCYFLASLAAVTRSDPGIVGSMIADNGDDTYTVRFYSGGRPVYYRIDADLPVFGGSSLAYAQLTPDGEIWVALVEKAYAWARTGQGTYNSIDWGSRSEALIAITGVGTTGLSISSTPDAIAQYVSSNLVAGHAVTAGTTSHAYMIESVDYLSGVWNVITYDPYGSEWRMTMSVFQQTFLHGLSASLA